MRLSRLLGERYREQPSEALLISHAFMLRGGYIRQVTNGIYSLLPPAKRIVAKIEDIIRQEMDAIDGQEVLFPVVMSSELWEESGRYSAISSELVRFKDRGGRNMVLGMTHEEAAVHLARTEAKSHTKYPFMIYQIQTKFRDEARPRGGLIRVREFTMKDAYSFHTSQECLEQYYDEAYKSYERIFKRAGLKDAFAVKSDNGMMGGSVSHEFMSECEQGEDSVVSCPVCGYKSNMEVAESILEKFTGGVKFDSLEKVSTPDCKTIEDVAQFFDAPVQQMMKAVVLKAENSDKLVIVFLRGDYEVNETKVRNVVQANVEIATGEGTVAEHPCYGFIGPVGINKDNFTIIYDRSLEGLESVVCGANEKDFHYKVPSIAEYMGDAEFVDVSKARAGDTCAKCGDGKLEIKRAIEIGNIFQLGTKYSEKMGMRYTDVDGELKTPIMGCYGIGVGRLMASVLEALHDDRGPIWPMSIAPWQIHLCTIRPNDENVKAKAEELYSSLTNKGFEVIYDDRNESPGVKFADADLLGVPVRVVVSPKNLDQGCFEVSTRDKEINDMVPVDNIEEYVRKLIDDKLSQLI
ncbi:MAG: proline--tRNA ligase [Eubacteriales bacterium]|nr:proline--tRNA ligase [Eubacteriales bacterium]